MPPLTMIVTVDAQSAPYAAQCLASITEQTNPDFDLILLQEQSVDMPLDTHATKHLQYQGALAAALTQVIAATHTDYITIVDAKDWLEPTYVQSFYDSRRTPAVDIIVGNYSRFDQERGEFLIHVFGEDRRTTQSTARLRRHLDYLNTQDEAYRRLGNTFIATRVLQQVTIPNEERSRLEAAVLTQAYEVATTVMYHHQAHYMVRILPEEATVVPVSLANVAILTTLYEQEETTSSERRVRHFTNANLPITVRPIPETLDFIAEHHASVARFGDGEMDMMVGHSIPYQDYDPTLAAELMTIYQRPSDEDFVVCQSDVFEDLERYNGTAQQFWRGHLAHYESFYRKWSTNPWYGSTFISRPYIDLADKTPSAAYFAQLQSLWQGRDILIVEGQTSRSGVGNDLFAQARSITRIIGPSRNAYSRIDALEAAVHAHGRGKLVLLMLGPTAKVLAYRLAWAGFWTIDIGHIDSEYEWFKMGATTKVKLSHKHTAEHNFDENITLTQDHDYDQQIVAHIK